MRLSIAKENGGPLMLSAGVGKCQEPSGTRGGRNFIRSVSSGLCPRLLDASLCHCELLRCNHRYARKFHVKISSSRIIGFLLIALAAACMRYRPTSITNATHNEAQLSRSDIHRVGRLDARRRCLLGASLRHRRLEISFPSQDQNSPEPEPPHPTLIRSYAVPSEKRSNCPPRRPYARRWLDR